MLLLGSGMSCVKWNWGDSAYSPTPVIILEMASRSACARGFAAGLVIASLGLPAFCAEPRDPIIISAELVQNEKAVAIRTAKGTQILDPAHGDTDFTGYDAPVISDDHHAAAWVEENGGSMSDASYPEPTGAWLFAHGRLVGGMGCDGGGGRPFELYFSKGGRTLVLMCEFAHGPAVKTRSLLRHGIRTMPVRPRHAERQETAL